MSQHFFLKKTRIFSQSENSGNFFHKKSVNKRVFLEKNKDNFFSRIFEMLPERLKFSLFCPSENFKYEGDISKISAKKLSSFFQDEVFLSGL